MVPRTDGSGSPYARMNTVAPARGTPCHEPVATAPRTLIASGVAFRSLMPRWFIVNDPFLAVIVSVAEKPITPLSTHMGESDAETVVAGIGLPDGVSSVPVQLVPRHCFSRRTRTCDSRAGSSTTC